MKIGELVQFEDRTLMRVEGYNCNNCYFDKYLSKEEEFECISTCRRDNEFTNKLIFSTEGLTLQIKRKGCKVKVKVLELSDEFDGIKNDKFEISKACALTAIYIWELGVYEVGDKTSQIFQTEQETMDWVDMLFSLRGEYEWS
jgi:hypothetical protein